MRGSPTLILAAFVLWAAVPFSGPTLEECADLRRPAAFSANTLDAPAVGATLAHMEAPRVPRITRQLRAYCPPIRRVAAEPRQGADDECGACSRA